MGELTAPKVRRMIDNWSAKPLQARAFQAVAGGPGPASDLCITICNHWSYIGIGWQLGLESCVLSANDATIFAADIFTRDDGVIIDRFRVSDAATGSALSARACTKIVDDVRKVMAGTLDISHLFREHHRKWKRRPKRHANPNIRTDVQFEDTARYTIIDVYAQDRVGFLYRVTETMSELGLNIAYAKIATRVDGILDAFYVLDPSGEAGLRAEARARRRDQPNKDRLSRLIWQKVFALPEYVAAGTVMAYVHLADEVRTQPLLPVIRGHGKRLVIPYCVGGELELFLLEELASHRQGAAQLKQKPALPLLRTAPQDR